MAQNDKNLPFRAIVFVFLSHYQRIRERRNLLPEDDILDSPISFLVYHRRNYDSY